MELSARSPASRAEDSQTEENAPQVAENAAPPPDVGDIQQYQTQKQFNEPYPIQGQSSVVTGSSLLIPLIGELILRKRPSRTRDSLLLQNPLAMSV